MNQRSHEFKKLEMLGDAVINLAAVEVANDVEKDRIKANSLNAILKSNRVLGQIARKLNLTPHENDPGTIGDLKKFANALEYKIGCDYTNDKVKALETAKMLLYIFYSENKLSLWNTHKLKR